MLTLYIGNKNYSSWSLRPWLALSALGIAFDERKLMLFSDQFHRELASLGADAGRVPVLVDDGFTVWDSLAIIEYVAEKFPDKAVWPRDQKARARARSICAEMHSGFSALRNAMGMNIEADLPVGLWPLPVQADVARIQSIWEAALSASGGPFLFGEFSAADAFYAPVVSRFITYRVETSAAASAYVQAVTRLPAMQDWIREARAEKTFLQDDEPYRSGR